MTEFACLYVGNASRGQDFKIETSTDVRAFLSIMGKAGCFKGEETMLADQLYKARTSLAHESAPVADKDMNNILKNCERLLKKMPNIKASIKSLRQIQSDGSQLF